MSALVIPITASVISTLLALIVTSIYNWLKDRKLMLGKALDTKFEALSKRLDEIDEKLKTNQRHVTEVSDAALQALLRSELYEIYETWVPKKYAPTWAKENFENLYVRYHSLGKNGVINEKREVFLALPDTKPFKEKKQ